MQYRPISQYLDELWIGMVWTWMKSRYHQNQLFLFVVVLEYDYSLMLQKHHKLASH